MTDSDLRSVSKAVLEADDRRRAASVAGDVGTLEQILTPDFTYIHNVGFREDREAYLGRMRDGGVEIIAMDRISASVRLCSGVALVEGEASMTYRMPPSASPAMFSSLFLAVWAPVQGQWRLTAYASTLAQP